MKKFCLLIVLLLAPSILWAQGMITISAPIGKVEIRSASARTFVPLTSAMRLVKVGDQIRTGDGGAVVLTLPDGSYMNVTPNSDVVIQDYWSGGLRTIANVLAGKVRFVIEKLGGQPNPVRVGTPTALIAVRGTIFDVTMDEATQWAEVACLEGQVGVETIGLNDREVLLDPGKKTQVRPGQYPVRPLDIAAAFPNRSFQVVQQNPADANKNSKRDVFFPGSLARDGDRGNRPQSTVPGSSPTAVDPAVSRAKPGGTLSFP